MQSNKLLDRDNRAREGIKRQESSGGFGGAVSCQLSWAKEGQCVIWEVKKRVPTTGEKSNIFLSSLPMLVVDVVNVTDYIAQA